MATPRRLYQSFDCSCCGKKHLRTSQNNIRCKECAEKIERERKKLWGRNHRSYLSHYARKRYGNSLDKSFKDRMNIYKRNWIKRNSFYQPSYGILMRIASKYGTTAKNGFGDNYDDLMNVLSPFYKPRKGEKEMALIDFSRMNNPALKDIAIDLNKIIDEINNGADVRKTSQKITAYKHILQSIALDLIEKRFSKTIESFKPTQIS